MCQLANFIKTELAAVVAKTADPLQVMPRARRADALIVVPNT